MDFVKVEGCGNDFVCVRNAERWLESRAALAKAICDRRRGIGADGLMLLVPDAAADGRMIFMNPDGSESLTCGNALRCAAMLLAKDRSQRSLRIYSGSEVRHCEVLEDNGEVARVRVSMGRARLERGEVPMTGPAGRVINEAFPLQGESFRITALSLGNPHVVHFVSDTAAVDVARWGAAIEGDARFPQRTNVEFVQRLSATRLRQRTYERGVGETKACGSGACASVIAGVLTGQTERCVSVELLGGELEVSWPAEEAEVLLTGPARREFTGRWH